MPTLTSPKAEAGTRPKLKVFQAADSFSGLQRAIAPLTPPRGGPVAQPRVAPVRGR